MQGVFALMGLFKIYNLLLCTFISMIYQISKEGGFCREKLDQSEERITHVCVCAYRERVCAIYILKSKSTHERVWNPLLPQINIKKPSASHCVKGRSSLKTRSNQL